MMRKRLLVAILLAVISLLNGAPALRAQPTDYVVQSGDTLSSIAMSFLGDGSRYTEIVAQTNAMHAMRSQLCADSGPCRDPGGMETGHHATKRPAPVRLRDPVCHLCGAFVYRRHSSPGRQAERYSQIGISYR